MARDLLLGIVQPRTITQTNFMTSNHQATETTTSFRHPPYTYLHLSLVTLPSASPLHHQLSRPTPLDAITALSYLTSALQQALGLTGTAITIDILKVEDLDVWIRVPYEDGSAVMAAISQWSSPTKGAALRVRGRGAWLGGLVGKGIGSKLWSLYS